MLLLLLLFLLLLCDLLFLLPRCYCCCIVLLCFPLHSLLHFCFVTLFVFQNKCEYCAFSITKLTFESISRYIELFVSVRLPVCASLSLSLSLRLSACICALRASVCMHRATKTTGTRLPPAWLSVSGGPQKEERCKQAPKSFNNYLFN